MNHFRKKEMLKSPIPIFIDIKPQMPPDTSKDLHEMQQHYWQQKVADSMILFGQPQKQTPTNSIAAELNDKQKAELQYVGDSFYKTYSKDIVM